MFGKFRFLYVVLGLLTVGVYPGMALQLKDLGVTVGVR